MIKYSNAISWQTIHTYWFGDLNLNTSYLKTYGPLWFGKNETTDAHIQKTFLPYLKAFDAGRRFDEWKQAPQSYVSYIVLLDQFSRNMFRDDAKTYAYDQHALNLTLEGLRLGIDKHLHPLEKVFFYLPLEHSEDLNQQRLSVQLFETLKNDEKNSPHASTFVSDYDYAVKHYDIVARFGRFPHRNKILNRESTVQEKQFLTQAGSSF